MKKVTIEITAKGYNIIYESDHEFMEEKHEATEYGAITTSGTFEDNSSIDDELYEAIRNVDPYDIMKALQN